MYDLLRDNRTVSGQTINAVEQLSLYPELITSLLYKLTGSQVSVATRADVDSLTLCIYASVSQTVGHGLITGGLRDVISP